MENQDQQQQAKFGGCEGPDAMFVKLVSYDSHEFIIKRDYALTSGTIKAMLSGPGVFWERLELYNFPIDVQELSVVVTTQRSAGEMNLISHAQKLSTIDRNVTKTFIDQQKWTLYRLVKTTSSTLMLLNASTGSANSISDINDTSFKAGAISAQLEAREPPSYCATCYCSRRPSYYFLNAYFLIFLLTGSSLTIFSMDRLLPQNRLQTAFTILLTSVSFKWVINRSLPAISYSTSLDKYSIASIFYLCSECCWHAVIGTHWRGALGSDEDKYGIWIDKMAIIGFALLFSLMNLYFVFWILGAYRIIRKLKKDEIKFLSLINKQMSESKSN